MRNKTDFRATFAVKDEFLTLPTERRREALQSFVLLFQIGFEGQGYFEVCDSTGRRVATGIAKGVMLTEDRN